MNYLIYCIIIYLYIIVSASSHQKIICNSLGIHASVHCPIYNHTHTYAAAAKTVRPVASVACQTELTWLTSSSPMTRPTPTRNIITKCNTSSQTSTISASSTSSSSQSPSESSQSSQPTLQSSSSQEKAQVSPKGNTKPSSRASRKLEAKSTGRPRKGEDDPVKLFNKFGSLEDGMDVDPTPLLSRDQSSSPRRGKTRSPIQHPKIK